MGAPMNDRVVTVFGGTGFLGRHVVRRLRANGFAVRIVSRHPDRADTRDPKIQSIRADIRNPLSIEAALVNAWGVVNAVSLYVEHGIDTFHAIHVKAAHTIAQTAREAGAERLIQISGIGADTASPSLYVRKRAEGEHAVQSAFPGAVIRAPGGDVRRRRRIRHDRARSHAQASGLPDVRPRTDADCSRSRSTTWRKRSRASSCARSVSRRSSSSAGPTSSPTKNFLRSVAREAGLRPLLVPLPVRRLAPAGADRGKSPAAAGDAQPGRADGGRHRHLAVNAGAARARHHAAAGRGYGP